MSRTLDLTALRSFVAVAENGGVTRAAGLLNLTQSAVSMQLKRLEESIGVALFERAGRGLALTGAGDQLLSYARRMMVLNDEVYARLNARGYEGEVTLGVPQDVIYPVIPRILQQFARDFPLVQVHLISSFTLMLKEQFRRGEIDVMLTTEDELGEGGETLAQRELIWVGAPGGAAWRKRPLPLAFERACIFRSFVQRRLDEAGIDWQMVVNSESTRTIEATVSADLAIHTYIAGAEPPHLERIPHDGGLPDLRAFNINLYHAVHGESASVMAMVDLIRRAYRAM
ncbi:LysR family transcriptional regulator [Ketogulonicigenium vulgare]|uniref:LysR family transcriptional regulator n=1 Tax=Ketogulonicigenium vulgare TaxID=92945 RepID=UPI000302A1FB|nr:LysR family transcriptional regulator [Ketogulonicigenium vulgare]ALJ81743.1 LysR family transcriptional regulator [Ketogulonicigenium vulgare]AOZ55379.1 LysR family transcriptional regulator [Ketogulonicigenium vulgare]